MIGFLFAGIAVAGALGFFVTPRTKRPPNAPVPGTKPFSSQSAIGCGYYRIPALLTTRQGQVIAAADARFGGSADSPNQIATAVACSEDGGKNWQEPTLAWAFQDWELAFRTLRSKGSPPLRQCASVIDPCLLEDPVTGKLFLLVDAFPPGAGAFCTQTGSGYGTIHGQRCLMLRKRGTRKFSYHIDPHGTIWGPQGKTAYAVNRRWELQKAGRPLLAPQRKLVFWYGRPFGLPVGKSVPVHLFCHHAPFHPLATSYLFLLSSDDGGKTWSPPVELNPQVKEDSLSFFGVCPGRGVSLSRGTHRGRLLFPAYTLDASTGEQRFLAIYSDDHGSSWQAGAFVPRSPEIPSMSETQFLPCPDGGLLAFSRTTSGYVARSLSLDGGVTWQPPELDKLLSLTGGSGCQVSVLVISQGNKGNLKRPMVLLSAAVGPHRTHGVLFLGVLEGHSVHWEGQLDLTTPEEEFAYSCLTELPGGDIGILCERSNLPQCRDAMVFRRIPRSVLEQMMN
ncbi:MAG: sialidase family protein [Acutalibacter sp.]|jgi:sialidase-1